MREAIVLDLGDLGAQAARLRMQAQAHAEQILTDANDKARALVVETTEAADARGHAEGLARGIEEGREQGRAQALAEGKEQLDTLTHSMAEVASRWEQQRLTLERDAREAVLAFALRAVEKLVHRAVEADPEVAARQVGDALESVLSPHDITVRIHPDDRPVVEEALPQLVAAVGSLGHVTLVDDVAAGRGGCVLETIGGSIDATIRTQLDRLTDLILPHDTAPAEPLATQDAVDAPVAADAPAHDGAPPGSEADAGDENQDEAPEPGV